MNSYERFIFDNAMKMVQASPNLNDTQKRCAEAKFYQILEICESKNFK